MSSDRTRREILENDVDVLSFAILPSNRDLHIWKNNIEFRNLNKFTAWTAHTTDGYDQMQLCLCQAIMAAPDELRIAWANAWPEHVNNPDAHIHKISEQYSEGKRQGFNFALKCFKVKTGFFSSKYLIFVQANIDGGSMPLGFAPAKELRSAIGLANMVMAGEEIPFRSTKAAIADRTL